MADKMNLIELLLMTQRPADKVRKTLKGAFELGKTNGYQEFAYIKGKKAAFEQIREDNKPGFLARGAARVMANPEKYNPNAVDVWASRRAQTVSLVGAAEKLPLRKMPNYKGKVI